MVECIAFDADGTLWNGETQFCEAQAQFRRLMQEYLNGSYEDRYLEETERRNIQHYGYGVKSFGLSMIETALELTEGRISPEHIRFLVNLTKEMLAAPVRVLPEVEAVLDELSGDYPLMVITKGDLLDQETRFLRSGLSEYFRSLEVVSAKDPFSYSRILRRHRIRPEVFLMVGNSLRSDIWPVLEIGGQAVYIPSPGAKNEVLPMDDPKLGQYARLEHIGQLPEWLEARLLAA
ncbi:MAG: HAD family hydrolase [Meiothermus sp.]|uniref:HAD family hydrolase n=1 Tax=Meiothermus sp. TaxID=1955249 RepID=UPI0025E02753|nr:HAD family hydrolase [Meiothermus sp.]MCS7069029.1 HAD family hydrolase [Meiothermus sp.]MDW8426392.1 HAD family hydrolase [Meiothermus sp.]